MEQPYSTDSYSAHIEQLSVSSLEPGGAERLKRVTLRIPRGEWVSLIGRNGSGKSTLLQAIAGFPLPVSDGTVQSGGFDEGRPSHWVPIVMQQPEAGLIGATPFEDAIAMLEMAALPSNMASVDLIEKAERALRRVGLGERMHEPIETLSGGQKQLTAIAGCVAADAPLLLLDEMTSMLDRDMSQLVLKEARRLHAAGATIVWATQKMEELHGADRVVALQEGSVVYDGSATAFFARESGEEGAASKAERLGFSPPYAVQTAWELEEHGIRLHEMPFTPEQLVAAVKHYER